MDPQAFLSHGSFIRLQQVNHKYYLFSDDIKLQSGSKSQLVGCVKDGPGNVKTIWQVFRGRPTNLKNQIPIPNYDGTEIWWDDAVVLWHHATKTYLFIHPDQKSPVTKQQEVSSWHLDKHIKEIFFTIQRTQEFEWKKKHVTQKISNNSILCLMNLNSLCTLHSHKQNFKQKGAQELFEVTGFKGADDNDYWQIQVVPQEELKQIGVNQIPTIIRERPIVNVHKDDLVILRNAFFGSALHSHSHVYKQSKNQEVTNQYCLGRDDNDWWEIKETYSEFNNTDFILTGSVIALINVGQKKFLTNIPGQKSPRGSGFEVTCKDGYPRSDEWLIEAIQTGPPNRIQYEVHAEIPVIIKHLPTDSYLCATKESSDFSAQNEIALVPKINNKCIWRIECVEQQK